MGWIGHALLVQPSISAHWKWSEMVVSASTNQVWTRTTIISYAWSFAIQNQIQTVCGGNKIMRYNVLTFSVPQGSKVDWKFEAWRHQICGPGPKIDLWRSVPPCNLKCRPLFLFLSPAFWKVHPSYERFLEIIVVIFRTIFILLMCISAFFQPPIPLM